jgi:hypothetical protein
MSHLSGICRPCYPRWNVSNSKIYIYINLLFLWYRNRIVFVHGVFLGCYWALFFGTLWWEVGVLWLMWNHPFPSHRDLTWNMAHIEVWYFEDVIAIMGMWNLTWNVWNVFHNREAASKPNSGKQHKINIYMCVYTCTKKANWCNDLNTLNNIDRVEKMKDLHISVWQSIFFATCKCGPTSLARMLVS